MTEEQYLVMEDPRDLARIADAFKRFTRADLYVEVDPARGLTFFAGYWDEHPHILTCHFPKERFLEWHFTDRFIGAENTVSFWRGTRRIKRVYAVTEPAGPFLSFYDTPTPESRRLIASFVETKRVEPPKIPPTPKIIFKSIKWEILESVMYEARAAGLDWLTFVGKPPEKMLVFGRDEIVYEAELPVDTVESVERDYVVMAEERFDDLRALLEGLTKKESVDLGKVEDKTIYAWSWLPTGAELTLYLDDTWVKSKEDGPIYYAYTAAIEAAKKELEIPYKPTPPPEVLPSPLIRVRFKYPWPSILVDKTVLGPFKRGDMVTAPPEALKRPLELGYAEKIEGSSKGKPSSPPELIISEEEVAFPSIGRLAEVGAY